MTGWWQDFKGWSAKPFSEDMPMFHWFLLIGMVLVFVVLWKIILVNLLEVISDA